MISRRELSNFVKDGFSYFLGLFVAGELIGLYWFPEIRVHIIVLVATAIGSSALFVQSRLLCGGSEKLKVKRFLLLITLAGLGCLYYAYVGYYQGAWTVKTLPNGTEIKDYIVNAEGWGLFSVFIAGFFFMVGAIWAALGVWVMSAIENYLRRSNQQW